MAGKGDKPRPVNKVNYDNNFDNIKWSKKNTLPPCKVKSGKKIYTYSKVNLQRT